MFNSEDHQPLPSTFVTLLPRPQKQRSEELENNNSTIPLYLLIKYEELQLPASSLRR